MSNQLTLDGKIVQEIKSNSDYWATPWELFHYICSTYNVYPRLDVCANLSNNKCESFYSEDVNGLIQNWTKPVWCNPPYSEVGKWVAKCCTEHQKNGITVTALIMMDPSTQYWHKYIQGIAEVHPLKGRVRFIDPKTGMKGDAARFASAVVIWRADTTVQEKSKT